MLEGQELGYAGPPLETLLQRYAGEKRRARLEPLYRQMLEEARRHTRSRFLIEEASLERAAALAEWLPAEAGSVILGIVTLGGDMDRHLDRLSNEDPVAEFILSEIATTWVTGLALAVHRALRSELATRGLKAGPPYRPGLGRWPLETQQTIFSLLPADRIGVTLDDYMFMRPKMSISLIVPALLRG